MVSIRLAEVSRLSIDRLAADSSASFICSYFISLSCALPLFFNSFSQRLRLMANKNVLIDDSPLNLPAFTRLIKETMTSWNMSSASWNSPLLWSTYLDRNSKCCLYKNLIESSMDTLFKRLCNNSASLNDPGRLSIISLYAGLVCNLELGTFLKKLAFQTKIPRNYKFFADLVTF